MRFTSFVTVCLVIGLVGVVGCDQPPCGPTEVVAGDGSCTPCPEGQTPDDDGDACLICSGETLGAPGCALCPSGQVRGVTGACEDCPAGSRPSGDTCGLCEPFRFAPQAGLSSCLTCETGQFSGVGATRCTNCPVNTRTNGVGDGCEPCPANTDTDGNVAGICRACGDTSFSRSGEDCAECPAGSALNGSRDGCDVCEGGTFSPQPGARSCSACETGQVAGVGATRCTSCPVNTRPSPGGDACVPCPANTDTDGNVAGICRACGDTSFSRSGEDCAECPAGSALNAARDGCDVCASGTFAPQQGSTSCSPCETGQIAGVGARLCTNCPVNTQPNAAGDACEPCPANTDTNGAGAGLCRACSDTSFSRSGEDCAECPAGSALNATRSGCDVCAAGTFAPVAFLRCTPCEGGQVAPVGSAQCTTCTAGTFASADLDVCEPCPEGSFSIGASTTCVACGPDERVASSGNTLVCRACASGTGPDAEHDDCVRCPAGQISIEGDTAGCVACPAGEVATTDATVCELCAGGQVPTTAQDDCDACPADSVAAPGDVTCTVCPAGQTPNATRTACVGELGDVDAPCTDEPFRVTPLNTSTFDIIHDVAADRFVVARGGPGLDSVDPVGLVATRLAELPGSNIRRVFDVGAQVIGSREIDFVNAVDVLLVSQRPGVTPNVVSSQDLKAVEGVGASPTIWVSAVVPVAPAQVLIVDAFRDELVLLDTSLEPWRLVRRAGPIPATSLGTAVGGDGLAAFTQLNADNTTSVIAIRSDALSGSWNDGFVTRLGTHVVNGGVQAMVWDNDDHIVYAAITALSTATPGVTGLMSIDLDDPGAAPLVQANEPEFPDTFSSVLSRPVIVGDHVVLVSQDIFGLIRATVFERRTLRRVGFLVDEEHTPAFGDQHFNTATASAARGSTVYVAAGFGGLNDLLVDVGACLTR